jgi:hypothetical protein
MHNHVIITVYVFRGSGRFGEGADVGNGTKATEGVMAVLAQVNDHQSAQFEFRTMCLTAGQRHYC